MCVSVCVCVRVLTMCHSQAQCGRVDLGRHGQCVRVCVLTMCHSQAQCSGVDLGRHGECVCVCVCVCYLGDVCGACPCCRQWWRGERCSGRCVFGLRRRPRRWRGMTRHKTA